MFNSFRLLFYIFRTIIIIFFFLLLLFHRDQHYFNGNNVNKSDQWFSHTFYLVFRRANYHGEFHRKTTGLMTFQKHCFNGHSVMWIWSWCNFIKTASYIPSMMDGICEFEYWSKIRRVDPERFSRRISSFAQIFDLNWEVCLEKVCHQPPKQKIKKCLAKPKRIFREIIK